jgi:GDP-mannose 6-dehydrogenase
MEVPEKHARVAVFGLGYVGCVTAACLADLGHRVVGVDRDEHKVRSVLDGRAPFFEPHLEELIQKNLAEERLSATVSAAEALKEAEIALICVGTPSEKNGNLDLGQLRRVVEQIADCVAARSEALTVAIRSTVFPGVCEEVVMPAFSGVKAKISVVSNPEFLREGVAIRDFVEPSLVVVGGKDAGAVAQVASLYASLDVRPSLVSLRTAEMIKYACNAFHALKVSFANEVGALCEKLDIDGREVMGTLCQDERLNISSAYLTPGFAFGGSCLPKDLRALNYRANRLDLRLPLLESTLPSNQEHLERAIQAALDLSASGRVGVIGLAFKENTDDLRESPVVGLLERLIGKGRDVRVWDAHIQLDSIYGANRDFILRTIPHIGRVLHGSLEETLAWAECLVITQKQRPEVMEQIRKRGLPGIDLVNGGELAAAEVSFTG